MEKFRVLGDELRQHYRPETVLEDIFRDIERDLSQSERVVCQYIINGMALDEKGEKRFSSLPVSEIHSLEYLSEKSELLVLDVIDGWLKALPDVMAGADALVDRLNSGETKGTIKAVYDLTENCEFLISSLWSARQMIGDARAAAFHDFERVTNLTRQAVSEAVRRLEAQDLVHLSQVIEYDLNHCLEEWRRVLIAFRGMGETRVGDNSDTHSVGRGKIPH